MRLSIGVIEDDYIVFKRGPPLEQGLSTSFRQKLPVIPFDDKFKATYQDSQCTVCLSDYQINEKLQQLPVCKHSFHVPCINQWLAKNATCPICRLSLSAVEIGCLNNPNQLDEGSLEGADATRMWEERVVNEAYDHSVQVRSTTSDDGSNQHTASSDHDISCTGDHIVNIERS
ncbi:hypothetical protein L7F22_059838 [Adiantum nelumboides]|nr:hypothetical protein [Adiantum nelumboides]